MNHDTLRHHAALLDALDAAMRVWWMRPFARWVWRRAPWPQFMADPRERGEG